ncbi:MAG: 4-hydroxybenzoate octaprenyltransferase [Anaplasma ovis]|uniref:4-hydroxybenzoate octaprenyltransferase n=1 Tax=Anaplasma ovis str. Haibei TaxID=1248439 RepID=A0A2Z2LGK8_9RICK|nr:4-hydroxybenzoate octaprenyltransferase [Anaplasma ovis]ASI47813.1 4-hydroxybenzoate polyprenyltransferase [Anaplasma ovis str. Haibei]
MVLNRAKSLVGRCAPYFSLLRLHSAEISLLAAFPTFASISIASSSTVKTLWLFVLSMFGAVVIRSAGCVINDIFDRKIDAKVKRTKKRPLASGTLTVSQALKVLCLLVGIALGILLLTNTMTFYLSIFFAVGIVLYPLAKRYFSYPQFFLGLVFNCGVLIGSAMAANKLVLGSVLMYIGCVFWTTAYDTIYACQDKKDDAILGLGSTAIKFGDDIRLYIRKLYILTTTMWVSAGVISSLGAAYYVCMLGIAGIFYYQYAKSDFDSPSRCMYMFKINIYVGVLLFLGAFLGRIGIRFL